MSACQRGGGCHKGVVGGEAEAMELQGAYWRKQLDALAAQAEEVRMLSTQVAADAAKPIKRGMAEFKKAR